MMENGCFGFFTIYFNEIVLNFKIIDNISFLQESNNENIMFFDLQAFMCGVRDYEDIPITHS